MKLKVTILLVYGVFNNARDVCMVGKSQSQPNACPQNMWIWLLARSTATSQF